MYHRDVTHGRYRVEEVRGDVCRVQFLFGSGPVLADVRCRWANRHEEQISDEGLTDGGWETHLLLEDSTGSLPTAKKYRVFSTGPWALDLTSASKNGKRRQKQSQLGDTCKNRNDTAGSISIRISRVC